MNNLTVKNQKTPDIKRLWHGTGGCPPLDVYSKDGFNIAYSNAGMWGNGIYFAVNANYSCPGYSYRVPNLQNTYEVFCANVAMGEVIDLGVNSNSSIKTPPNRPDGLPYDSIKAHTAGSDIYIVYKNVKTYPAYLVRYTV